MQFAQENLYNFVLLIKHPFIKIFFPFTNLLSTVWKLIDAVELITMDTIPPMHKQKKHAVECKNFVFHVRFFIKRNLSQGENMKRKEN